jgi:predicted small integral membrane protein
MTLRWTKVALIFGVALYYTLVVFNNLTDYSSNFQFVRHVLTMDTIFPGNHAMWRALNSPAWHTIFYLTIIAWEILTMLLCWLGGWRLLGALRGNALPVRHASSIALAGLTSGLLMWLVAFLTVGGEWFLMWQSRSWNGQETAFRMFAVLGIVLLVVLQPESDETR